MDNHDRHSQNVFNILQIILLISLTCFSSKTLKMQVFLFSVVCAKRGVVVAAFIPSGDCGSGS